MAVKIQVKVFWIGIPCSVVVEYQCFGGPCCLLLQGEVKMGTVLSSETLVFNNITWYHSPEDLNFYLRLLNICRYRSFVAFEKDISTCVLVMQILPF
jgi:hypothetical protein